MTRRLFTAAEKADALDEVEEKLNDVLNLLRSTNLLDEYECRTLLANIEHFLGQGSWLISATTLDDLRVRLAQAEAD